MKLLSHCFILSLLFIFLVGCTSDNPKKNKEDNKAKNEMMLKEHTALVDSLQAKYNGIAFPFELFDAVSLSYELQKYLNKNKDKNIIFETFLVDIYDNNGELTAEFLCPYGSSLMRANLRLKLRINEEIANALINSLPSNYSDRFAYKLQLQMIPLLQKPTYFIVAEINNAFKVDLYIPSKEQSDTKASIKIIHEVVATGTLKFIETYKK